MRSLSQAVDAYGKAAQMLGVPEQGLWHLIPGVEQSDIDEWKQLAAENDQITRMQQALLGEAADGAPAASQAAA